MYIEKVENKTREQVVVDCSMAVFAAWQHYVDSELSDSDKRNVRTTLDTFLPRNITTENWRKEAQQYLDDYEVEN